MSQLRELWSALARWYAGRQAREQRLLIAMLVVGLVVVLDLVAVQPIRAYRRDVAEEIESGLQKLEHDLRKVGRLEEVKRRRDELRARLEQVKTRLLPGDTGTLGAAALQERTNAIAAEKGATVQSTQVMRDEAVEPFRKVAVRLTLSAEPKPLAEFLAAVEYAQQLNVPFIEISRRGVAPGQKGPRVMQVSVEVSGYVLEGKKAKEGEEKAAEGDGPPAEGPAEASSAPGEAAPAGRGATEVPAAAVTTSTAAGGAPVTIPPAVVPSPASTTVPPPPTILPRPKAPPAVPADEPEHEAPSE